MEFSEISQLLQAAKEIKIRTITRDGEIRIVFEKHEAVVFNGKERVKCSYDDIYELTYSAYFSKSLKVTDFYMLYPHCIYLLTIAEFILKSLTGSVNSYSKNKVKSNIKKVKKVEIKTSHINPRRQWINTRPYFKRKHHSEAVTEVLNRNITNRRILKNTRESGHSNTNSAFKAGHIKIINHRGNYARLQTPDFGLRSVTGFNEKSARQQNFKLSVAEREENEIKISSFTTVLSKESKDVKVFYSTNRVVSDGNDYFTGKTEKNIIHYGIAYVSIPKSHKRGKIEKPLPFFNEHVGSHFVIKTGKKLAEGEFFNCIRKESKKKRLLLYIHGFNVSFKDAVKQSAQIKEDLTFDGPVMLFSWPSNGSLFSYSHDKESSNESSSKLASILNMISEIDIEDVFVVAHSMGAFCLAEALKKPGFKATGFNRIALAAPDIKKETFSEQYAEYFHSFCKKVTIYVSSRDLALMASRWKNESNRLGDAKGYIEVIDDVDTVDMTISNGKLVTLHHSYLFDNQHARMDLMHYLINGILVSSRGLQKLENKFKKIYWSLPEFK